MLEKIYHQIHSNDIQRIIGDFNTQIGQEYICIGILGKHRPMMMA
jgi:hypothetical protein